MEIIRIGLLMAMECPEGSHLLEGLCFTECPDGYYQFVSHPVIQVLTRREVPEVHVHHPKDPYPNVEETNVTLNSVSVCRACHYSCQSCKGPNDDNCLSCHLDSELQKGYCYPTSLVGKLEEAEARSRSLGLVAKIVCPLAILLALYLVYKCCKRKDRDKVDYGGATYTSVRAKDTANGTNGLGRRGLLSKDGINIPDSEDDY